jgi:hypothetical protein
MYQDKIAFCGLFCGGCGVFQKTTENNPIIDENGNKLICKGCRSEINTPWCMNCEIKNCIKEKGLHLCIECEGYICSKLSGFMNDPLYVYHQEVDGNMRELRELGEEKWIAKIEKQYVCNACGTINNWFTQKCSNCNTRLNNGRNPITASD